MQGSRLLRNQRGVTLLAVLVMVVITGLLSGMAGTAWRSVMQQVKEEELLWRGDQYRKAIESYYSIQVSGVKSLPGNFEDLLRDPRSQRPLRHLRRIYPDPFTGGDWVVIKDPAGKIKGVRSSSREEPFKKDGFADEYANFKGKMEYREWEFAYTPTTAILPGTTMKPTTSTRSGLISNQ